MGLRGRVIGGLGADEELLQPVAVQHVVQATARLAGGDRHQVAGAVEPIERIPGTRVKR